PCQTGPSGPSSVRVPPPRPWLVCPPRKDGNQKEPETRRLPALFGNWPDARRRDVEKAPRQAVSSFFLGLRSTRNSRGGAPSSTQASSTMHLWTSSRDGISYITSKSRPS